MLNRVQHDGVGVVRASFFRRRSRLSFFYSSMIPINLSHPNHETASLRSQRQVRGCHCEPRFFVWWSSLVFSPKRCHCEVVCSFPKQSLFFSLVPESFILKTLHEKGESPNKKGKGRKNKRMLTHPSPLIGKLQTYNLRYSHGRHN